MRQLLRTLVLLVASTSAASAWAQPGPFGVDALDNVALARVAGGYASPGFSRNARAAIDQSARSTFDATASINRVTFDNWFAREGAELISAGVLGRPLLLD